MKYSILFSVLTALLIVSSAFFARHLEEKERNSEEVLEVMAYGVKKENNGGYTVSDLAESVSSAINGEVTY